MSKLRAGVIGVGYLGAFHAEKYQRIPGVKLVGLADTNFSRAKEISNRYNVEAHKEYKTLLPKVDILSIVVPSGMHYEVAKDCLARGIHCLVEKPLTENVNEANELVALAKDKQIVLQVGHLERFNPVIKKVSHLLKSPYKIKTRRFSRQQSRGTDTDVILDLMIHDLDIVLSLANSEVIDVQATGSTVITDFIDIANAMVFFKDGLVAELGASRVSTEIVRDVEVCCKSGKYVLNFLTHEAKFFESGEVSDQTGQSIRVLETGKTDVDALYDELVAFVESIQYGGSPVVSGEDGKRALELAVEISSKIKSSSSQFPKSSVFLKKNDQH